MSRPLARPALAALAVLVPAIAAGCGGSSGSSEDAVVLESGGIAVLDAWARPTPGTSSEAAVYVTIENRGAPDDRLIGARSDRCMVATLHATTFVDDVAEMDTAGDDQLGLARDDQVVMEPNGLHVMCLGLDEPLVAGETLQIELEFAEHPPIVVPVTIEQR